MDKKKLVSIYYSINKIIFIATAKKRAISFIIKNLLFIIIKHSNIRQQKFDIIVEIIS